MMPENEVDRLSALRRYDILDTPPDGSFDRLTGLAARLFQVPIAVVTLVENDRNWFKSNFGLPLKQIDRDTGLCAQAILQPEVYMVVDAKIDPRTRTNPLVTGELGLRFYAGAPLRTQDGYSVGTLCIIDHKPRQLSEEEKATLKDLASIVVDEMELRLASQRIVKQEQQLRNQALNEINLLKNLAHEDALTGLGNRRAFERDLENFIVMLDNQKISDLSLAVIDLDGLKQINNLRGHGAGDFLLKNFANHLRHGLSIMDGAYRFGGDEFALILPETTSKDFGLLNNICQEIVKQTRHTTGFHEAGASLGIAAFSEIQTLPTFQEVPL